LLKNQTIKFHREERYYHSPLPTCEGYIMLDYHFSIDEIIKEEDKNLLIKQNDLIESIIQEIWGEYDHLEQNMMRDGFFLDKPYSIIHEYTKKTQN
jgi:hypothetical protein